MNQREARRLVTQRVATVARKIDDFDAYGPDDRRRLRAARDLLVQELEIRCGVTARPPATPPLDPDQIMLDYSGKDT